MGILSSYVMEVDFFQGADDERAAGGNAYRSGQAARGEYGLENEVVGSLHHDDVFLRIFLLGGHGDEERRTVVDEAVKVHDFRHYGHFHDGFVIADAGYLHVEYRAELPGFIGGWVGGRDGHDRQAVSAIVVIVAPVVSVIVVARAVGNFGRIVFRGVNQFLAAEEGGFFPLGAQSRKDAA